MVIRPNDRRRSFVVKSRKEYTCILGGLIPQGSSYIRLEIIAGGCGGSWLPIAISKTAAGVLMCKDFQSVNFTPQECADWIDSLEGEKFFSMLDNLGNNSGD